MTHAKALRVAVIGAGISGLTCARLLDEQGARVTVFEKSRGPGGRMSTRRSPPGYEFDHGAQYFTVRDSAFQRSVQSWIGQGTVEAWAGRIVALERARVTAKESSTPRFVGVRGMNAVCQHLARGLDLRLQAEVGPPAVEDGVWQLSDSNGRELGSFDWLISSAPAPQSAAFLRHAPDLQRQAQAIEMRGCWAVMLAFERSLELPFDGAFVHGSELSWVARNDSKPGRDEDGETWILHASPEWSQEHMEDAPELVRELLTDAFWRATGIAGERAAYAVSHRWRYAVPPEPLADRCLFDAERRLGACGDWCGGPRVEGAFLSGVAIAEQVLEHTKAAT